MFKNLIILALSVVISFSAGLASTQYCPYVKKHIRNYVTTSTSNGDCCPKE